MMFFNDVVVKIDLLPLTLQKALHFEVFHFKYLNDAKKFTDFDIIYNHFIPS
jgi:hypothetical protein